MKAARHPVFAWFIDSWLLVTLGGFAPDLLATVDDAVVRLLLRGVALLFALAVVALYHWRWYERTAFLTPGELLGGAAVRDGEKVWLTPYVRSRELLFLCVAGTLLMYVPDVTYANVPERVAGLALTLLLIPCLVAIGRGYPAALAGVGAYRVWQAYAATGTANPRASVETLAEYVTAALFLIACAVVALIYQGRLVRKQLAPAV